MSGRLLSSMFLALFEDSDFGAVANGLTSPSFEIVEKKYQWKGVTKSQYDL